MMRWIAMAALAACGAAGAVAADFPPAAPELTVEQILEKNAVARGGLEAWRKIQTMVWVGHMESPGGPAPQAPFVLQQKRPNKTRFELNTMGEKSLRVFDGKHGWKAHPGANGRPDVRPFTAQELRFAQEAIVIDSPLIDHDAKRIAVELGGEDEPQLAEGRFQEMRASAFVLPGRDIAIAGQAKALLDWHRRHGFCPNCGHATQLMDGGYRRQCPQCAGRQ